MNDPKVTIRKVGDDKFIVRCQVMDNITRKEFGSLSLALQYCQIKGYDVKAIEGCKR